MSDAVTGPTDDRFKAAFGSALARLIADPQSDVLLAEIGASAWQRNGCMAFATALADYFGGTLVSIGWYALLADHVAVSLDGMLFDADGAFTEHELLAKYSRLARAPLGMWPLTPSTMAPAVGNEEHRAALAALLRTYLPKPTSRAQKAAGEAGVERRGRPRKAATPKKGKAARV